MGRTWRYHDTDSLIYGFSHTYSAGHWRQRLRRHLGDALHPIPTGRHLARQVQECVPKSTERGHAGTMRAFGRPQVLAELTTTPRVGIHRYTLDEPDTLTWTSIWSTATILKTTALNHAARACLSASREPKLAEEQHVYFAMAFDRDFEWGDQLEKSRVDTPSRTAAGARNVDGPRLCG